MKNLSNYIFFLRGGVEKMLGKKMPEIPDQIQCGKSRGNESRGILDAARIAKKLKRQKKENHKKLHLDTAKKFGTNPDQIMLCAFILCTAAIR